MDLPQFVYSFAYRWKSELFPISDLIYFNFTQTLLQWHSWLCATRNLPRSKRVGCGVSTSLQPCLAASWGSTLPTAVQKGSYFHPIFTNMINYIQYKSECLVFSLNHQSGQGQETPAGDSIGPLVSYELHLLSVLLLR